jgi:NOL1/NOP2/sun family putative RNA methylase
MIIIKEISSILKRDGILTTMKPQYIQYKPAFKARYEKLTNWEVFSTISKTFLRRSVRINTLKRSIKEVKARLEKQGWQLTPVPWCKEGFWVKHKTGRLDIGNTVEHQLGYYYIQEAASMLPPLALDPQPGETILDMCAAPGSKTTQIAQYMKGEGMLLANDYQGIRLQPLGINLQRMGVRNAIITLGEGRHYAKSHIEFDRILVDAPCSGTGTIRKSLKTIGMWNPHAIRRLNGQQRQLLETAFKIVKKGGIVVYSTCSLEPEEDEEVVSWLLDKYPDALLQEIKLTGLKTSPTVKEFEGKHYHKDISKCLRIWPQDNDSEGFFVAKIKKT